MKTLSTDALKAHYVGILKQVAAEKGLDSDGVAVLTKIMHVESGGDLYAMNEKSSARGLYQCINDTWEDYVKKHPRELTMDGRHDAMQQTIFAVYFTQDNQKALAKAFDNKKPTHGEIYLAHFLGAQGAILVLNEAKRNPDRPIKGFLPQLVLDSNSKVFFKMDGLKGLDFKEFSVGDLANWAGAKMGETPKYQTNSVPHYKKNKLGIPEPVGNLTMVAALMAVAYLFIKGITNVVGSIFGSDDAEAKTPPPPPRRNPSRGRA